MSKYIKIITKINLILGILFITNIAFAQDGKVLFEDNCTACHTMGMKVVGPDLVGVKDRRSEEWIASFIKNSTAMIEAGDPDAVKVFEENGKVPMTIFQNTFSDEELASLVKYIVEYKAEPVVTEVVEVNPSIPGGTQVSVNKPMSIGTKILISLIVVPLIVVLFLLLVILARLVSFSNIESGNTENIVTELFTGKISDEVIEGHSYDGIMELNNSMPPWLKWLFGVTILFAVVYLFHYELMKTGPTQAQEYENEMAEAVAKYGDVNIVSIKMEPVTDEAALNAAKDVYTKNCVACHKADGGGSVGPNLTDNFWLNGGSLEEVFNTIRNGVPGKAMVAWKGKISDKDILSITSYIKNMKGSNPKGAKEAEGTEVKE